MKEMCVQLFPHHFMFVLTSYHIKSYIYIYIYIYLCNINYIAFINSNIDLSLILGTIQRSQLGALTSSTWCRKRSSGAWRTASPAKRRPETPAVLSGASVARAGSSRRSHMALQSRSESHLELIFFYYILYIIIYYYIFIYYIL